MDRPFSLFKAVLYYPGDEEGKMRGHKRAS